MCVRTQSISKEAGLTLVELLAVIVLIGLIATVVIRGVGGSSERAKAQINVVQMENVKQSLSRFRLEYGFYPSQLGDLIRPSAEVKKGDKPFFPFASEDQLKDVWHNDFIYKSENNGRSYALTSLGSDGSPGGEDAKQDVTMGPD